MSKTLKGLTYDKKRYKAGKTTILYDTLSNGVKNLFIVSTPMQLLTAIEAQNHFKTKNNVLVILFFLIRDGKNINQMFKLSESFPYSKLILFQNSKRLNFFAYTKYLKEIGKYSYQYLFFGYSTPLYRRMVANCNYKKLYFLDDGVHTLTTHEQIYNDENIELKKHFKLFPNKKIKHKLKRVAYFSIGYTMDTPLHNLNFFTTYNLIAYKNEEIIKHQFSYVRELFFKNNFIEKEIKVYILGQPLVHAIGISSYEYLVYLKGIFDFYKDREILYIPHRTEEIDKELEELVLASSGVEILYLDEPIEFYFMNRGIYPVDVASFITSALFSIKKIFPNSKPLAFEINLEVLSEYHQKNIELIYSNYQKESIDVVKYRCEYSFKKIKRGSL